MTTHISVLNVEFLELGVGIAQNTDNSVLLRLKITLIINALHAPMNIMACSVATTARTTLNAGVLVLKLVRLKSLVVEKPLRLTAG